MLIPEVVASAEGLAVIEGDGEAVCGADTMTMLVPGTNGMSLEVGDGVADVEVIVDVDESESDVEVALRESDVVEVREAVREGVTEMESEVEVWVAPGSLINEDNVPQKS